ncbi:hypothetical protein D5S17_00955 [Pseudonocardiaceae bacterium YIM PH 21723]|nr:hypothetical protein D5S17_00955 [Pseudonocardiaceae bacterium YIM PH 21723]
MEPRIRLRISELDSAPLLRKLHAGFQLALWRESNRPTAADQRKLYAFLESAARVVFGGADHSAYWEHRQAEDFFGGISTFALIITPEGEAVGWGGYQALRAAGEHTLYLDYSGVLPEYRRYKLGSWMVTRFLRDELRPWRSLYVSCRTQNPSIYRGLLRCLGQNRVWPPLSGTGTPGHIATLADDVAGQLGQRDPIDPDSLVIKGVLSRMATKLYGEQPVSGQDDVDRLFGRLTQDDAIMIVARLDLLTLTQRAWVRLLDSVLPRRNAAARRASRTPSAS